MNGRIRACTAARRPADAGLRFVRLLTAVRASLARYCRFVAQPWRMSGDQIAHGNRR